MLVTGVASHPPEAFEEAHRELRNPESCMAALDFTPTHIHIHLKISAISHSQNERR